MNDMQQWASLGEIEVPVHLVLVVDDEPAFAAFARGALESKHISVRIAREGGQAQASFQMHKPDFVILDLILPGESGFEICERLKHTDPSVPILMVTAIDLDDARELAERVGADGYLCKPISEEELVAKVREVAEVVWRRNHLEASDVEGERVRFSCGCGKKFKVSASHRGKSMTCPNCGEPVIVPRRSA